MKNFQNEIRIGNSSFHLSDDNIIHSNIVGDIDEKTAIAYDEATLKLMNMVDGKVNVLVDNSRAGRPSSKARKIMGEFILHEKYGKLAIYGLHPVSRVLASFFMGASRKKDMRFFKTKEEALVWLRE
jgi:hypothetical protein